MTEPLRLTVLLDHWPALTETFVVNEVLALHRAGHDVRVETAGWASVRAETPESPPVACADDDPMAQRALALAWLCARHPRAVAADLLNRRRWRREELVRPLRVLAPQIRRIARHGSAHVHAHFAALAALDALRIGRFLDLPYSVMAHAYEIYRTPANLPEKLRHAQFSGGECEYSVRDLRTIAGPGDAARIHVIVMGVDHERFRREQPHPAGRTVLAVGRMVPKKGFTHLLDAFAGIDGDRLVLIGDGPLRPELEAQSRALGMEKRVEFRGAQGVDAIRAALEEADVVAITAVPASDGDRDVLPLIAGEALAMEVPVVASDFVGLPEVIRPPWGRLFSPGDATALADALSEVLAMPPGERAAAGRAGREFVVRTRDIDASARRVAALIRAGRA
jgi:colanic acid/amylovoran biosynthesis glycosyltransferase